MQLFYIPDLNPNESEITFSKLESGHIVRVLRKKEDDLVYITDGKGGLTTARIRIADRNKCTGEIVDFKLHEKAWNYHLHIAIAPTKSNDRFEWFLEKATEIGIDEITPLFCEHSERKVIKPERFEKIIQSASKQSLKYHFPQLNAPVKFTDFVSLNRKGQCFVAHCDPTSDKLLLKNQISAGGIYTVLIGPEGDFSKREIAQSLEHKYIPVSLGESRLRTETAGVVATHSIAFSNL
jgi:16S rRNA (uracil1498-N3)-methyltransferase